MCTNTDDTTLPLCGDCNKEVLKWREVCSEFGIELTPEEAGFDRKMAILMMLDNHTIINEDNT